MADPRLAVVIEAVDNVSPKLAQMQLHLAKTNDSWLKLGRVMSRSGLGMAAAIETVSLAMQGQSNVAERAATALAGLGFAALMIPGPFQAIGAASVAVSAALRIVGANVQERKKEFKDFTEQVETLGKTIASEELKRQFEAFRGYAGLKGLPGAEEFYQQRLKGAAATKEGVAAQIELEKALSAYLLAVNRMRAESVKIIWDDDAAAAKRLAEAVGYTVEQFAAFLPYLASTGLAAERARQHQELLVEAYNKSAAALAEGMRLDEAAAQAAADAVRRFYEAQDKARASIEGSGVSFQQFLTTAMQFPDIYNKMKTAGDALGITPGFSAVEWSKLAVSLGITVEELNTVWVAMNRLPAVADTVSTTLQANWINAMHYVEQYNRAVEEGARITQNAYARLADDIRRVRQESMEAEELRQEIRLVRPDIRGFGVGEGDVVGLRHILRLLQIAARRPQVTNVFLDGRQVGASIGDVAVADEQVRAS